MEKLTQHWTSKSVKDFVYRIASDFVLQLEKRMDSTGTTSRKLAKDLKITEGRVSQFLNDPSNFKLSSTVEYAQALGMKVAIVAYDDKDPQNERGPIGAEIFARCWEKAGRPKDFYDLNVMNEVPRVLKHYPSLYEPLQAVNVGIEVRPLIIQKNVKTFAMRQEC